MRETLSLFIAGEKAMVALGERLGDSCSRGIIFLEGDLGAGKTTLCRGIMHSRGHRGAVKSPTYTLVEPYALAEGNVYHFDLYRLSDPEELEFMGIRDYFTGDNLCVVEWPDKGEGVLPKADIVVAIGVEEGGRKLSIMALTPWGERVLGRLSDAEKEKK